MVAFKNSTGIKANSSFCTFRFPIAEAHQLTKPFQYQPITTTSPTQPFAHFVFMPIRVLQSSSLVHFRYSIHNHTIPSVYVVIKQVHKLIYRFIIPILPQFVVNLQQHPHHIVIGITLSLYFRILLI